MPKLLSQKKADTINWGIIGCGNVTEFKSGPAFNKAPQSSLVAVMRRDEEKARDYAQRHRVKKWYRDADELINNPEINAIYIATPPKFHEEYAIAAMQAGKPVYIEKPMSVDVAACIRMLNFSKKKGVKLTVAHYRRALPMFLKIKELLAEQIIGDIRFVNIRFLQKDQSEQVSKTEKNWRVDPAIAGAGLFYDLAPHQLDLVFYFFGKEQNACGFATNQAGLYQTEDIVTGNMLLQNNILFNGTWCFTVPENLEEDLFEITGSKGRISFPVFGHRILIETAEGKQQLDFEKLPHIQQPMIEKVVQYFLGNGNNPCSALDAIQSMSVMEKFVYGSHIKAGSL
ncbi:MAG: Gfo/Idh/MocA family oxidoreductase [Chitinophagaceae bacterium]|nr:Gfo/Idh/MocA family oxidoreductase [Chitinophagaceae bacterium]